MDQNLISIGETTEKSIMVISVKYALDSQSGVGVFTAELKTGESCIVVEQVNEGGKSQISLINEDDKLHVIVKDSNQTSQMKGLAKINEVYCAQSSTMMLLSFSGSEAANASPVGQLKFPPPPSPPDFALSPPDFAQSPPDFAQSPPDFAQSPPDFAQSPPDFAQGPLDLAQSPSEFPQSPPDFAQGPSELAPADAHPPIPILQAAQDDSIPSSPVDTPIPLAVPNEDAPHAESQEVGEANGVPPPSEDTFTRNFLAVETEDPGKLPPVAGAKLNYNFELKMEAPAVAKSSPDKPQFELQNIVSAQKQNEVEAKPALRAESQPPRTRHQLLSEDLRDRRRYHRGMKYSLRNKVALLVLSLGVVGIGLYAITVSHLADKAQRSVFADSIQNQAMLKGQELRVILKYYNNTIYTLIQTLSVDKTDIPAAVKGFSNFDFIVGIGAFRYVTTQEYENFVNPRLNVIEPLAVASTLKRTPAAVAGGIPRTLPPKLVRPPPAPEIKAVPVPPTPTRDLSGFRKLEDGNFLEPILQWVRDENDVHFDKGYVTTDQLRKVIQSLGKNQNGPQIFDPRDFTLPNSERGIYTYVVRSQLISPIFIVVQTTTKFIDELFLNPGTDMEMFLMSNKNYILFPEASRNNLDLLEDLKSLFDNSVRSPASEFATHTPVTANWDLVVRPSQFKTAISQSQTKSFMVYGLIIILAFLSAGLIFAKNLTHPLRLLVKQIESVAAGDYQRRWNISSNDEIGVLADHFEFLTQNLRRKEQELAHVSDLASKDSLTGLYNHRYFINFLSGKWKEIETGKTCSLVLMDVDNFRFFNMAHGHSQGDVVLKDLAQIIVANLPAGGLVARYGSEEFALWLPDADEKSSFELSENLIKKVRAHKFLNLTGGPPLNLTCSFGVTTYNRGKHLTLDSFLLDVDGNLHMAKKAGRNRIWASVV